MNLEKGLDQRVQKHVESDERALEGKLIELRKQIN
jgi:hypothetical protein